MTAAHAFNLPVPTFRKGNAMPFATPRTDVLNYSIIDSPVGEILLTADDEHLTGVYLDGFDAVLERLSLRSGAEAVENPDLPVLVSASAQLGEYFAGQRTTFDLPLAPTGTDFQLQVWEALTTIPFGTTAGYGELAGWIDRPTASRAVGAANGRNPISIIVPCHRVIGASGALTGYAWGEERKRTLLDLEGVTARR